MDAALNTASAPELLLCDRIWDILWIMKRIVLTTLLACAGMGFPGAREDGPARAADLVGSLRDSMYSHEMDDDSFYRQYRITLADLGDLELAEREELYWYSLAAYYLGRSYHALDTIQEVMDQDEYVRRGQFRRVQRTLPRLDDLIPVYEQALAGAEDYLKGGRDSRGVWLYAQCLSHLATLRGLGSLFVDGSRIQPLAEEAVELDASNVKARLLIASRYVYSPGIWGGDPDKGIAMLEEIRTSGNLDTEDLHNIDVAVGFAHTMAERWADAIPFFERALKVYPGNIYAAAMVRLCRKNS